MHFTFLLVTIKTSSVARNYVNCPFPIFLKRNLCNNLQRLLVIPQEIYALCRGPLQIYASSQIRCGTFSWQFKKARRHTDGLYDRHESEEKGRLNTSTTRVTDFFPPAFHRSHFQTAACTLCSSQLFLF